MERHLGPDHPQEVIFLQRSSFTADLINELQGRKLLPKAQIRLKFWVFVVSSQQLNITDNTLDSVIANEYSPVQEILR